MDTTYVFVLESILNHAKEFRAYPTFEDIRKATRLRPAQLLYCLRELILDEHIHMVQGSTGREYVLIVEIEAKE